MKPLTFPAHEAALEYLALGLSFYPKKPGTKMPMFDLLPRDENGKKNWCIYRERLPTEAEASRWFRRRPQPNIAIITGKICVLDLDTPEAFEFCATHGGWPEQGGLPTTPTVRSRRGMHLYFLAPATPLRFDAIPGADLLSGGKCCTAPPSVHECGHVYRWITPLSVGFQPLPSWIVELAVKPVYVPRVLPELRGEKGERYALAALRGTVERLLACGSGRNSATRTAAFTMRQFIPMLGEERIAGEILEAAMSLGLSESEAGPVIRRGLRA